MRDIYAEHKRRRHIRDDTTAERLAQYLATCPRGTFPAFPERVRSSPIRVHGDRRPGEAIDSAIEVSAAEWMDERATDEKAWKERTT
jgi:hypothetical protein